MTNSILIDTSVLVAYYDRKDPYHTQVKSFFANCSYKLITNLSCVTEVMWLLAPNMQLQNNFLLALSEEIYICENLLAQDFNRIAELNTKYANLKPDFADLSLVVISERLDIPAIATLDKDFNIYRRYRSAPFERVF
jgi:uncharacterized protein